MRNIFNIATLMLAAALTACGGGGGSPGETHGSYSITLRADKDQLPINIASVGPSTGAYARYTTTLYVEAREGNAPIPGGKEIFSCNLVEGLDTGALVYLDGDEAHKDKDGNELAFRAITLDANSGAASFHFHAGTKAGTARVICTVTNPRDKNTYTASTTIVVGAATGKPASVWAVVQAPGFLGTAGNTNQLRNSVGIQAFLMDDANQPVPEPSAANMRIRILPSNASVGARLLSDNQSGAEVQVRTIGGVGLFSLSSGLSRGVILLEIATDRSDNDVSNDMQDPIVSFVAVNVNDGVGMIPLDITSEIAITVNRGLDFAYALSADGGVPPYTWTSIGALPAGLTLNGTGVVTGNSSAVVGDYGVVVQVTDSNGATVIRNMTITVKTP